MQPIPDNLFLIGLMGAGKTSVGRQLALRLGKTFCDADAAIEARCGVKVSVIFDVEGEAGFRRREAEIIAELTSRSGVVVATGGGAILHPESRTYLRTRGTAIYLAATLADLWARTRHDRNRPLLQTSSPRETLERLLHDRDPLYREVAHLVITTGRPSVQKLTETILEALARNPAELASSRADHTLVGETH